MSEVKIISAVEIQGWVVAYLADILDVEHEDIDVTVAFDRFGLDSSAAIGMTGDLEEWLGYDIDATVLYDYPTIQSLSQYLGKSLAASKV